MRNRPAEQPHRRKSAPRQHDVLGQGRCAHAPEIAPDYWPRRPSSMPHSEHHWPGPIAARTHYRGTSIVPAAYAVRSVESCVFAGDV
jgi:hypothetical protein